MNPVSKKFLRAVLLFPGLVALVLLSGCASMGPSHMDRDREDYNLSLTESWKRQILLNVVKIRYVEPLFFVDVGEIVAAYALETGVNVGASRTIFDLSGTSAESTFDLGMSGKYTDRPTITYRPMTGTSFLKGVMSPIPVGNVILRIDSGVSAAFVMNLGVRSVNGFHNEAITVQGYKPAQPGFKRVVEILCKMQEFYAMHVAVRPLSSGGPPCLFLSFDDNGNPETKALIKELKDLLRLDPLVNEFTLSAGAKPDNRRVIALQTYSLAQILAAVAARVKAPEQDVESKRAIPGVSFSGGATGFNKILVHSSDEEPEDAFAAVKYKGSWFWVDDHDLAAKRVFSFIMLAFTLLDTDKGNPPLQLTIPAQ